MFPFSIVCYQPVPHSPIWLSHEDPQRTCWEETCAFVRRDSLEDNDQLGALLNIPEVHQNQVVVRWVKQVDTPKIQALAPVGLQHHQVARSR